MAFADKLAALQQALSGFNSAVVNAANRKVSAATAADDAAALNGQSASTMIAAAASHTDAHANRTDNPHATTAAQLNAFTKDEVTALIASLLPAGIFPIDQFGTLDTSPIPQTNTATVVNVTAGVPLLISGQYFTLPALTFTPGVSKTIFVYAKLVAGAAQWLASQTEIADSLTNMLVGKVITDASGNIASNTIGKVTRVDGYRISTTAAGSAIPVSTGLPSQTGTLAWK